MSIDPTAHIDSQAQIDPSAIIGRNVVIEGGVQIGPRVRIHHNATICKDTIIEADCTVHMGAVIGHEPQDLSWKGGRSGVTIGRNTTIRENVTIHRGTKEGTTTVIGSNNYLMAGAHVAHNCLLHNNIILANNVLLGGYVEVEDNAFISGGAAVHQFCRIGCFTMIGGLSRVNKDAPPYMMLAAGGAVAGINIVGLRRAGFTQRQRSVIKAIYKILYRSGHKVSQAVKIIEQDFGTDETAQKIIAFISSSKRGLCKGLRSTPEHQSESD